VAPSADRTIQILDLLTTHPGRGFTLSELSRRLLMNKATAFRLLGTLTKHALLVRNPHTQEYRLGPALIPMGSVAARSFPALDSAKAEAERLAELTEAECVLLMPTGDEILVIGRAGMPGPLSFATFEGQRHPLIPPLGSIFFAWRPDREIGEWLDRAGDELSAAERQRYRDAVAADRRRGYNFALRVEGLNDLFDLYVAGNPYTPVGRQTILEAYGRLAHDAKYLPVADEVDPDAQLSSVAAPVFGPDGALLFSICLLMGEQHRGADLPALARAVTHAAGRVTRAIDGHPPVGNGRPLLAAEG
jgi:DNA-binding IclR family transcriptional regulator